MELEEYISAISIINTNNTKIHKYVNEIKTKINKIESSKNSESMISTLISELDKMKKYADITTCNLIDQLTSIIGSNRAKRWNGGSIDKCGWINGWPGTYWLDTI
jgi:hypothetical protein